VIDLRDEQANAFPLVRVSSDSASNEIDESELHGAKHNEQRTVT
jgi:hypothetical protein